MTDTVLHLAIIAGGKGQRLWTIAGDLPKALVPIGGKPVLQHQLELAAAHGIRHATIFAGHGGEQIAAFTRSAALPPLAIETVIEQQPLGSAGALLGMLDALPAHFIVMYGDLISDANLERLAGRHFERGADFTLLVHPNDHPQDSDLVELDDDGWVRALHAYPHRNGAALGNLVNAALYVVRRDALRPWAALEGPRDFIRDLVPRLIESGGRVLGVRSTEYLKDMGTPERLAAVEADLAAGRIGWAHRDRQHAAHVERQHEAHIERQHATDVERPHPGRPAVLFDRDGTLNVDRGHLRSVDDLELVPGASAALKALRRHGFRLAILTNQPVIARGEATEADVAAIHRALEWKLGVEGAYVDGIYICPHHTDAGFPGERAELKFRCDCRKPETGLFEQAKAELDIDPSRSWMIGDSTRDVEMARRAGLKSILVKTGAAGRDGAFDCAPDFIAENLSAAVRIIEAQIAVGLTKPAPNNEPVCAK